MDSDINNTERRCKRCQKLFTCRADAIEGCQCNAVLLSAATLEFLKHTEWGCLCSDCLQDITLKVAKIQTDKFPTPSELIEGIHYYIENGLWVFTEYYHMLRGHCCESGCRHCAYGYKK